MLHLEDLDFWIELAIQQGSPILELGCGTGRVLLPLARAKLEVYGLDHDPGMLRVLRDCLPAQDKSRTNIFLADMARFRLSRQFGLILLTCNTLSTLPAPQRIATLACVSQHLRPDGVFAASLPNPSLLKRLPASAEAEIEDIFPHPQDGQPVQVSSSWRRTASIFTVYWYYDHLLPDGKVERIEVQARHHLSSARIYLDELREAGFASVQTLGDFDYSPYGEDSPYLILLANHKRSS